MGISIRVKWYWHVHLEPDMEPCEKYGGFYALLYREHWWNKWKKLCNANGEVIQFQSQEEAYVYFVKNKIK